MERRVGESKSKIETATEASDLVIEKLYQHRFSASAIRSKAKVWKVIVERYLQRWIAHDDVVLDLGCGYGEFLNFVRARRRIGIDFNPDSTAFLEPGIEFRQGDVTDLSFLQDEEVSFVFTSNMLEHLRGKQDVERLLVEARRVLKPGGVFVALGPNMRFLHGKYWDYWDHSVAITDRSLVEVLTYLDFSIEKCIPRFLPYTTKTRLPQASFLVDAYLHFPPAWPILGRQFLIKARRHRPVEEPR